MLLVFFLITFILYKKNVENIHFFAYLCQMNDKNYKEYVQDTISMCIAQAPNGTMKTAVKGVKLFWGVEASLPRPLVYQSGLFFLIQGEKKGQIRNYRFVYDQNYYLVFTSPVTSLCSYNASYEKPVCGLFIEFCKNDIREILTKFPMTDKTKLKRHDHTPRFETINPTKVNSNMRIAIHRLLTIINDDIASQVLGKSIHQEILFYALQDSNNSSLRSYYYRNNTDGKIDKLIEEIYLDIAQPVNIQNMAKSVNMSSSTFYRFFIDKTGQSPLQFIKKLRLHKARDMIVFDGISVGQAAHAVGYESQSQFSREFKKYFDMSAKDCNRSSEFYWKFSD